MIGGSIISGVIKSHQASKAANAQKAAADEALKTQKEQYAQTRQDLGPYTSVGGQAFGKLGDFLGVPKAPPGQPAPGQPGMAQPSQAQQTIYGNMDPRSKQFVTDPNQIQTPGMPGYGAATSPPNPSASGGRKPVMMRAPDGTMKAVDNADVGHYTSLGATVVG